MQINNKKPWDQANHQGQNHTDFNGNKSHQFDGEKLMPHDEVPESHAQERNIDLFKTEENYSEEDPGENNTNNFLSYGTDDDDIQL